MMMQCPVCNNSEATVQEIGRNMTFAVSCPLCGKFTITQEALDDLPGVEAQGGRDVRRRIARYLYENNGKESVLVSSYPGQHAECKVLHFAAAETLFRQPVDPFEMYKRSVLNLRARTHKFGQVFSFAHDRWLIPTMDDSEAGNVLNQLVEEGHVRVSTSSGQDGFCLTSRGFEYAEQLVAMPTAESERDRSPDPVVPASLFLSHSHADDDFVKQLAGDLESRGVRVWYDGWDLDIGHNLTLKIQEGIRDSQFLAVVLSPSAVKSAWVEQEWTAAFDKELQELRVIVLPILYEDCDRPVFLQTKKYADFRDPAKYQESLADLIRCVRGESKRPPR